MVEVDASAHSNFDGKNVASFSKYVPRTVYNVLADRQAASFTSSSAQSVLFGSLFSNVGAFGLR